MQLNLFRRAIPLWQGDYATLIIEQKLEPLTAERLDRKFTLKASQAVTFHSKAKVFV